MEEYAIYIHFLIEIPNNIYYELNNLFSINPPTKFNLEIVEISNFFDKKFYKEDAVIFLCVAKTKEINKKKEMKIQMNVDYRYFESKFIFDCSRTLYLFNFSFEPRHNKKPPNIHLLTFYQQFHIFFNYLKKKSKNFIYDKRILIFDSIQKLTNESIEFDLVLALIRECYRKKQLKEIIMNINEKKMKFIHRKRIERNYYENIINGIVGKFKDDINPLFKYHQYKLKDLVLDKIALFFYRIFDPELIKKYFEKSKNKSQLINILFDNRNEIGVLKLESVTFYLQFAETKYLCNKVLSLSKDRLTYLQALEKNIDLIKKKNQNRDYYINNEKNFPKIYKDDDVNKIFTTLFRIYENNKSFIVLDNEFIKDYIEFFFKEQKLNQFIKLYDWLKKEELFSNDLIRDYNSKIKDLLNLIITLKNNTRIRVIYTLNQNEIIQLYYIYQEEKLKIYFNENELSKNIIFSSIDDEFIKLFKKLKFDTIRNLFQTFFQKIQKFQDINILFELVSFQTLKSRSTSELFKLCFKKYENKFIDLNEDDNEILSDIIVKIIVICENNYINYEDILKIINNLNDKQFASICPKLMREFDDELPKDIFGLIIEHLENIQPEDCLTILQNVRNNKLVNLFFEKCENTKIISLGGFFSTDEKEDEKYNFLKLVILNRYFEKDEINFIIKSKNILTQIKEMIMEQKYKIEEILIISELDNKQQLEKRLFCVFQDEQKGYRETSNLVEMKNKVLKIRETIENIIYYISNYFKNSRKEYLKELLEIQNNLLQNEVKQVLSLKIPNSENYLKKALEIKKIDISLFFKNIYDNEKNNDNQQNEDKILKKAIKKFNGLEDILNGKKSEKISEKEIKDLVKQFNKEDDLINEINTLKNIFFNDEKIEIQGEKNLILIYSQERVKKQISNIIKLSVKFEIKNDKLLKKLNEIKQKLENDLEINELSSINNKINELNLPILNNEKGKNIIDYLFSKDGILDFLYTKQIEDIRNLEDFAGEDTESYNVDSADLRSLGTCVAFISELKNCRKDNLMNFLNDFIILTGKNRFEQLDISVKTISDKYYDLSSLYSDQIDKDSLAKKNIEEIYKKSTFLLKYENAKYICEVDYDYKNKDKEKRKFEDILDYRDNALMRKKDENNENDNNKKNRNDIDFYDKCVKFASIIGKIIEILRDLNSIANKGYFEDLSYKITINHGNEECEKLNVKDSMRILSINELNIYLKDIIEKQIKGEKKSFEENEVTRLIYGRQFNTIYTYLTKENNKKDMTYLNKYLTNNKIKKDIKIKLIKTDNKLSDMYNNANNYINQLLKESNLNYNDIYEKSIIIKEEYTGIYSLKASKEDLIKKCVGAFYQLTNNFPTAQTVLYCNEKTNQEEIISYLYRAIKANFKCLFGIITPENLSISNRKFMFDLMKELLKDEIMKSCILIIYIDRNNDLVSQIIKLPEHKFFVFQEKIKNVNDYLKENKLNDDINPLESTRILLKDENEIEVYHSDASGVGKSRKIIDSLKNNNDYNYFYFPIGGEITRNEILDRLLKIEKKKKIGLHLDLYDTSQIELINEFLFKFLITKCYSINDNLFYYGNEIIIKIEVPNGFVNYFHQYPILNNFKKVEIPKIPLPALIVEDSINSNMQITCNYLKYFKDNSINNADIVIEGVSTTELKGPIINITQPLPQKECSDLIKEYMRKKNPTYYQINAFINILADQLKYFTNSIYLNREQLDNLIQNGGKKKLQNIRHFIIDSLIKLTEHFISSAYENVLSGQSAANEYKMRYGEFNAEEAREQAAKILIDKKPINFSHISPSLVYFNEDKDSLSIITNSDKNSEEYQNLYELFNSNKKKDYQDLINYKELNNKQFLEEIKKLLDLKNNIEGDEIKFKGRKLKPLLKVVDNYVFTADNFIKMVLILLRIRANIPVIMMGETGCGKTSLIRIISELKNNTMKILNIHAGTTDKDIINFMKGDSKDNNINLIGEGSILIKNNEEEEDEEEEDNLIIENIKKSNKDNNKNKKQKDIPLFFEKKEANKKSDKIPLKEKKIKKQREKLNNHSLNKKEKKEKTIEIKLLNKNDDNIPLIWVFLDEINTCNSMGLISEMMCKHTIYGNKIYDNIQFIAACNPYRVSSKKLEQVGLYKKSEKRRAQNLIYIVNPLPHSLLNFVFDFGNLNEEDEKRYIHNMILQPFKLKIKNERLRASLIDLSVKAITTCQNFIREKYDISSVSLREVRRFIIFYKWFFKFLKKKKDKNENYKKFSFNIYLDNEEKHQKYSIILSIYICYYIRIFKKVYRNELKEKMNEIFGLDFEHLPLEISKVIADETEVEEGIAKNRALLDNLFSLFVCISNKIPIFICGKPGCSKSLSAQLIFKSMKGEDSNSKFFKQESKLIRHSYQGSLSSTSEGVLKVFKVARKAIQKKEGENNNEIKNIISMIYFDEMGLAEISPNNPLKVIHSQLEYDENKDKVAFVGISNWTLDASKMNRGIYLSIPEPDKDDLIETALKIAESYDSSLIINYKDEISQLAESYYEYRDYLSKQEEKKKDFHGSRDFYHLIKVASKKLKERNQIDNVNKLIDSIERNFGGLKDSIKQFKKIFKSKHPNATADNEYDVKKCINENLNDNNSRYLLIITKSSVSEFLIKSILKTLNKKDIFYIGSNFENDNKEESYIVGLLNKIQYTVSQDNVMILKNLDSIYPSLYDLFNQNFIKTGNRNYAKISLGYSKTHTYYVNDNFKCVVLLDSNEIENQDPPFLNRFEKHIVSFDFLLSGKKDYIKKSQEFSKIINELIIPSSPNQPLKVDLSKQLLNCDLDEIQGIIYQLIDEQKDGNINIFDYILEKISPTFSQDIIAFAKNSNFQNKNQTIFNKIITYYEKYDHNKLISYLEKITTPKHIIYTFSNIIENIFGVRNEDIAQNKKYGYFKYDNSSEILIQDYYSEREIEEEIRKYYEDNTKNLCILSFENIDCVHLNHINFLICNYENQKNIPIERQKVIIFTIHIKRYLTKCIYDEKDTIPNHYLISHLYVIHKFLLIIYQEIKLILKQFYILQLLIY